MGLLLTFIHTIALSKSIELLLSAQFKSNRDHQLPGQVQGCEGEEVANTPLGA